MQQIEKKEIWRNKAKAERRQLTMINSNGINSGKTGDPMKYWRTKIAKDSENNESINTNTTDHTDTTPS